MMQPLETSVDLPPESLAEVPVGSLKTEPTSRPPRIWKFWGTALWGLFIFAAMCLGQIGVGAVFVLQQWRKVFADGSIDLSVVSEIVGSGSMISWSVIMGLPAVLAASWIAIRPTRTPFNEYLGLAPTSWRPFLIGFIALAVLVTGWDMISRVTGREVDSAFMGDILKSAQGDGTLWLLLIAFCIAAPVSEEFLARGFLYRGWSESFLGPIGAILLSSAVWTAPHLQYGWFALGEVFSIGVLFGFLRYRFHSTWLTVVLHCLNNLAATLQGIWLLGSS